MSPAFALSGSTLVIRGIACCAYITMPANVSNGAIKDSFI
jgi:hypothetical protein